MPPPLSARLSESLPVDIAPRGHGRCHDSESGGGGGGGGGECDMYKDPEAAERSSFIDYRNFNLRDVLWPCGGLRMSCSIQRSKE